MKKTIMLMTIVLLVILLKNSVLENKCFASSEAPIFIDVFEDDEDNEYSESGTIIPVATINQEWILSQVTNYKDPEYLYPLTIALFMCNSIQEYNNVRTRMDNPYTIDTFERALKVYGIDYSIFKVDKNLYQVNLSKYVILYLDCSKDSIDIITLHVKYNNDLGVDLDLKISCHD